MKQSTLFAVFTKNTTVNGTSSQLDHPENNEKANKNARTLAKSTSNLVDTLTTQAESSPALDENPISDDNVRNSKVNTLSLLAVEPDNEGKKMNTDENINCKRQGKLSLSSVKKLNAEVNNENKSELKSEANNHEPTGKFVTVQSTPINLQSRLKESKQNTPDKQNTPVEHSDTQLSSGTEGKKEALSINYADFLAQMTQKSEQKIQQSNEISTPCSGVESIEVKKVMSYSEFIGMFKSPPKAEEESAITIDDEEPEKCPLPLPFTEQQKEIKCKSIASFFTKIESAPRKINASDVTNVTVIAEVHSPSSSVEKTIESSHPMKLPGKMKRLNDEECEIEFLSSETITDVDVDVGKKVHRTKRNGEALPLLLQVSKKTKVEHVSVSHEQTIEAIVKKSKNETPSDVSMKTVLKAPATSKKIKCLQREGEAPTESTSVEKIESSTPVSASSAKSSQSTLHFGTNGFSLKKTAELKIGTDAEEDSASDAKILAKKPTEKQSSRRNKLDGEEERKPSRDVAKEECERTTKSEQKTSSECNRESTRVCDKEPALSIERLSQRAAKEKTETGEDTTQVKTEETGTLRRSARLAQSFHATKDEDVVEITSDDEDDVAWHGPKKRGRKAGVAKPAGKLAPIFTSVKSKELVGKSAPVDPEQERLRREFMMSGIPDELKRQIATTAANTNLVQEYPPLPIISHVQQISVDEGLSVDIKIPELRILDDSVQDTVRTWENLGWKKTQSTSELHRDPFKMFAAHPPAQVPHVDLLLQELQCCDGKFPFRTTYEHLHSKVTSSEIAPADAAGNKCAAPTVIDVEAIDDDDDVIICDASQISELHPLKTASESKASLWSDLHQPESSKHIIGNAKAMKQLKEWLEEWKVVLEKQVRKASKISKNTSKSKNKGGWSDDSDFTDSEEEEETLCNSVLISGVHGIGKTASVYALAKELGYKVFEVNSSSLRSGKQLLAQLEEATQSHRVAQNKIRSAGSSDTPPAGSSIKLDAGRGASSVPKPKLGTSAAFANLFRVTPQAENTNGNASLSRNSGGKLKGSGKESRSGRVKRNGETPESQTVTESVPARSQRKKKNEALAELDTTKPKKQKDGDKKVEAKHLANGDCSLTSGSLNLTSASLILFDEVDVVFEEDKGFLATVQHFMMSTKIPIVLTSTYAAFRLQLQARHDHICLSQPPLISAASFLSTICLAHGIRISHRSVLNALHYTGGDIRRCLLSLQFWCESGGGVIQVAKDIDSNSLKTIDNVVEKSLTGNLLAKTFRSRIVSTDDSNDSDFISLRPPRKKARRVTSDDDSSMDTFTVIENSNKSSTQSEKVETVPVKRKENKLKNIPLRNQANVITEDTSSRENCQLPLVHTGFEESLLGLHGYDLSVAAVMGLIKTSAFSYQTLDHAVNTFSVIAQALNKDVIYHVALQSLPLPKVDSTPVQLTIPAPLEVVASEVTSRKKPRRRIMQGDWMDSDSSDADLHLVKDLPQHCTNVDEHPHENSTSNTASGVKNELSANSIPEKGLPERNKASVNMNNTTTESKGGSNSLTVSLLAEFSRYYDNLSYIDYMETKSSMATDYIQGIHICPGLSDDETQSKLVHGPLQDQLQCYSGSVNVLAARQLYSGIEKHVKKYELYRGGDVDIKDSSQAVGCNGSESQPGIHASDWPEELHLPLEKSLPDLWSIASKPQNQSTSSGSAFRNVCKCLRPTVQSSDPALYVDYVPYLRDICRSEDERRLAKTQRRFHHYLNSIGLGLKESTIASLASTYVIVPNGRQQDS